jgi:hypothetical protein
MSSKPLCVGMTGIVAAVALGACAPTRQAEQAAPPASNDSTASHPRRLLVKLATPSADTELIARVASAAAGVRVRHAAAASAEWHALVLLCSSATECDAAVQRLRGEPQLFTQVDLDERRSPIGR